MTRARRIDTAIVLGMTPIWLMCVALHANLVWEGRLAWVPVYVEPAGDALRVTGLWPDSDPETVGLHPGDRVLRVGDEATAGWGRLRFLRGVYDSAGEAGALPVEVERAGERLETTLRLRPIAFAWRTVPLVIGLGVMGLLLPLRGRGARAARDWAAAGLALSLHWSLLFAYPGWQSALGLPFHLVGAALVYPFFVRAALRTPGALPPPPRWLLALPWLLVVNGPATASWLLGVPWSGELGLRIIFLVNLTGLLAVVAALLVNFRRSDLVGRRTIKWVVFGVTAGALPVVIAAAFAALDPALWWVYELSLVATILIPLCVFIAFVRDNFLDVNRLLTATAVYSVLSVLALSVVLYAIPTLTGAVGERTGISGVTVQAMVSVVLAAIIVPVERAVRPGLERLLFRERHALERGLKELRGAIGEADSPQKILGALGERLAALLRLDTCVVYSRGGGSFAPSFAVGRGVPPGFGAKSKLIALLEESGAPVAAARWQRWARRGHIDELEAASLDALGAALVLPVRREDDLAALVCLGEKQSGDVYTANELTLLEGIADRAGLALTRFDERDAEAEAREKQRTLRRYVPEAVVSQLERGGEIAPGGREVTVLFIDLRGYTTFSETRTPDEIFRTINAYTHAVATCVQRHGGTIVDFQGDGLFAVFGAPEPLPGKERQAVDAALEALEVVAGLETGAAARSADLRAGIGIATGEAYVGNIEAADRTIWGVIGNTTNLAARLQSLTRELETDVVVDATTWERAGPVKGFERREGVRVKGRSEPFELFAYTRGAA